MTHQTDFSALPDPVIDAQFYDGVPFKRFLAWVLDFAVILTLALAAAVATLGVAGVFFPLTLFILNLIYRIYMLQRYSATLGMLITGVEIRGQNGDRLDQQQAIYHTLLFTAVILFFFTSFISMVMMLINSRGQGLHDYFLGTTAINRPVDH